MREGAVCIGHLVGVFALLDRVAAVVGGIEQLSRKPFRLPTLNIKRKPESIFDYTFDDFEILNYTCHPHIKAPVAV